MKEKPSSLDAPAFSGEQNDPVWALLGRAPLPQPDAWFAARTLARCRSAVAAHPVPAWERVWRWSLGSGVAISLALFLFAHPHAPAAVDSSKQKGVQEAFEIMASMDPQTDAAASSSSWQDSTN